jgi:glycosyltransferase involved in cell wall biosynthesis
LMLSQKQLIAVEHINHPWKGRRLLGRIVRFILRLRSVKWIAVSNHFFIWPGNKSPAKVIKNSIKQGSHKVSSNLFMERNIALKRSIFIGRLTQQKRPDWAIEVASACKIRLEIFGTGKQEGYLRQLAQSLGMNAHFNSYKSDLWELIEVGDLLIVPSEYEGDGLVVVEGLSAGIPMLISDIPDFRRFEFPNINYCGSREEFIDRISLHKDSLENLLVPTIIADSILQERSSNSVGDSWEEFFRSCCKIDS